MEAYRCIECIARTLPAQSKSISRLVRAGRPTRNLQYRAFTTTGSSQAEDNSATASRPRASGLASLLVEAVERPATTTRQPFLPRRSPFQRTGANGSRDTLSGILKERVPGEAGSNTDTSSYGILSSLDPLNKTRSVEQPPPPFVPQQAPFKCGPMLGRTVHCDERRGIDVGSAFRILGSICTRNKIAKTFSAQKFHERGGLRRKRLKSERYQARFKSAFREMVGRVQTMRKMGW